jgi:hypothetical protein
MAFTTAGLANSGVTTHCRFQYGDSLQQSPTNPTDPKKPVCRSRYGLKIPK